LKEWSNGEIRESRSKESQPRNAGAQKRNFKERTFWKKSNEPKTSDRDRPVGGAPSGRKSSAQEIQEEVAAETWALSPPPEARVSKAGTTSCDGSDELPKTR
jgi:hypothetical protein